jgi:hypothetical protein
MFPAESMYEMFEVSGKAPRGCGENFQMAETHTQNEAYLQDLTPARSLTPFFDTAASRRNRRRISATCGFFFKITRDSILQFATARVGTC